MYSDEGTTNFNLTGNVIQSVKIWLQGCRPGCPWIGPNWQDFNWYDTASKETINVQARCPLIGEYIRPSLTTVSLLLDSSTVLVFPSRFDDDALLVR